MTNYRQNNHTFNKKPNLRIHKRPKTDFEFNEEKANQQQEINKIEKYKIGYESLSQRKRYTF